MKAIQNLLIKHETFSEDNQRIYIMYYFHIFHYGSDPLIMRIITVNSKPFFI